MAKQVGPLFFTGTVDGLIFYKLGDHYYMRSKGDYKSGKQMRKDLSYKRTMQQADRFGEASNLLKKVYYRHLPKAVRKHGLYGNLTGMINTWLYQGKSRDEVRELLLAHCQELAASVTQTPATLKEKAAKPVATNTEQRPTANAAPSTTIAQRSASNAQPKRARYLSRWKVKRNGRLHVPREGRVEGFKGEKEEVDLVIW